MKMILMLKDTPDGFLSDFLPFRHLALFLDSSVIFIGRITPPDSFTNFLESDLTISQVSCYVNSIFTSFLLLFLDR